MQYQWITTEASKLLERVYMKQYFMLCAGLLGMLLSSACLDDVDKDSWAKTFGGDTTNNYINACETTCDGGCICVGSTYNLAAEKHTILMIKINSDGTVAWRKNYGDNMDTMATSIISSPVSSHYIVAGTLDDASESFLQKALLLTIDTNGTILSQKTYELGEYSSVPTRLCITSDGGLMVSGYTSGNYGPPSALFMLKLNCKGVPVWQKQYGLLEVASVNSVFETHDHGFLVAGSIGWASKLSQGVVLKLDAAGNIKWQKETRDQAIAAPMGTDGYIVTTNTSDFYGPSNTFIFSLDMNGNVGWAYTLEGLDGPRKILQTKDSGYLLAGTVTDDSSGSDIWLAKLSGSGMFEWQKTIGDEKRDKPSALLQTPGGAYIVAGNSQSGEEEHSDALVTKLDSTGSIPDCTLIDPGAIMSEKMSVSVEDTAMMVQNISASVADSSLQPIDVDIQETTICSSAKNGLSTFAKLSEDE